MEHLPLTNLAFFLVFKEIYGNFAGMIRNALPCRTVSQPSTAPESEEHRFLLLLLQHAGRVGSRGAREDFLASAKDETGKS